MDLKYFSPEQETIDAAIKIEINDDSPMKFECYTCHHPHDIDRPDWGNCLECHKQTPIVGAHGLHIQEMGLDCNQCHRPHNWTVTEKQAKETCTGCHEYRNPESFIK
jgi:hypothetical protein